jgi:hypothetical protein
MPHGEFASLRSQRSPPTRSQRSPPTRSQRTPIGGGSPSPSTHRRTPLGSSPVPPFKQQYGGPFGEGMERWAGTPKSPSQPMESEELDVFKELQEQAQKIVDLHAALQVEAAQKRRAEETWLEEQRQMTLAMSSSYAANYSDDLSDEEDVLAYCPSEECLAPGATALGDDATIDSCSHRVTEKGQIEAMQDGVSLTFRSETVSDGESAA